MAARTAITWRLRSPGRSRRPRRVDAPRTARERVAQLAKHARPPCSRRGLAVDWRGSRLCACVRAGLPTAGCGAVIRLGVARGLATTADRGGPSRRRDGAEALGCRTAALVFRRGTRGHPRPRLRRVRLAGRGRRRRRRQGRRRRPRHAGIRVGWPTNARRVDESGASESRVGGSRLLALGQATARRRTQLRRPWRWRRRW